ncbi:MAG: hypothetical protein F6K28_50785, partial [Microcoleus sp. SIO2G3]|nr:hypothetical protein [Microcoleus sp. SIO2G3]
MRLPREPICEGHFCVSGDVSIAPSASIAPGVLLQADPGSRLVIGADVCIGAGSVVQAHQGMLEIASGATLGAEVLIVGKGCIGANSCIGARATVWNTDIAPDQVVASGALIGEMGRQVNGVGAEAIAPQTPVSESEV